MVLLIYQQFLSVCVRQFNSSRRSSVLVLQGLEKAVFVLQGLEREHHLILANVASLC